MIFERLVLASGNRGKLRELADLLDPLGIGLEPQSAFDIEGAEETAETFVENALLKARHASRHSALPALADDSGLLVPALDGAPGVRSARYAGPEASDADNLNKLLAAMKGLKGDERHAYFHCTVVLLRGPSDPAPLICEGIWRGLIAEAPRGEGGFGYDPVFLDPDLDRTAAELEPADKHARSHRGQALAALVRCLELEA